MIEVSSARQAQMHQAVACIVAAFVTDPIARFAWLSPHQYLEGMTLAARRFGGSSFECGTADVTPDFCGVGLWLPPGVSPDGEALEKVFRATAKPEHLDDLLATFEGMDESHPKEKHWYLPMIGVDPSFQNRGLGAALMHHATARADADGTLAYLESTNSQNISLYERHGFEVVGKIQIGEAPLVTPMLRYPSRG